MNRSLLLLACFVLLHPVSGRAENTAPGTPQQGQAPFETLASQVPLSELAPVPLSAEDERIDREVDQEICAAYRRWRASPGNASRANMEAWCPTGN